jgi:hypothetical protein
MASGRHSYLPGEKFTISELLQSYNLPADVEVVDGLLGETREESLVPGQKIRFHFLVEEEVIAAVREDEKGDVKIPLHCSLNFELLPDDPWLDDQRYKTVREAYSAKPKPKSVFATCSLLLPDGYQVDDGDEIEFTGIEEDPTHGMIVAGFRRYFNHEIQEVTAEHYRFPIDLEANFSTSAPVKQRYLAIEIVHQLTLPRRVRMHHRREGVDKLTGIMPPPRPAIKMILGAVEKRFFVVTSDVKTGKVFSVPINTSPVISFVVKDGDTRSNSEDDHAHLLYGLVDFWALPRIGKEEENAMVYEDPLPVVKVPPNPQIARQRAESVRMSYQLIPTHEFDRVAVVFAPKDKPKEKPSFSTSPGVVHFYEAFRSSTNRDSCVVRQYDPPMAKRNVNLENAVLEYQLNQLKKTVPQSLLDQLDKKKRKDSPPPPVLPKRMATLQEIRVPAINTKVSGSPPVKKSQIAKGLSMMKNLLKKKITGDQTSSHSLPPPTACPSPPSAKASESRSQMPPPVTTKPKPTIQPKTRPPPSRSMSTPDDEGYVRLEKGEDQIRELKDELDAEEEKNRMLKQQLAELEKEYEAEKKRLDDLQSVHTRYDDENPQNSIVTFSVDEVIQFLKGLNMEQYESAFREFEVEGYWLVECDKEALDDMGVRPLHVRRILCAVQQGKFPSGAKLSQIMSGTGSS